ncbi:tyrosine-protein phosphatase [Atopococcus tabaci]|uniref:tyrosine-protein phosphatase n=1 Tax=Atopococcus tabaci TaxID=269774 RepID=UPI000417F855|nr:CpsB/CapC family capsule biosynthesis tyrosine phosphatase [Atopococcus tabaci]
MIDLHCHILPGLDDGAQTMEVSLDMARAAVKEGITHILATPHHKAYSWENDKQTVLQKTAELQKELDAREIPLTIFPGQEVRMFGELPEDIEQGTIQFIDEQNQYLLVEFPSSSIPHYTERLFYELQAMNVTPIIVHPERNRVIQENPEKLKEFIEKGALSQLTAASYTGGFGKTIKKLSYQLIEANLVHFIASDAHNVTNRLFHMQEAHDLLAKEFGSERVRQFEQITKDLVNGEVIVLPTPQSVKKKKFFGLF